MDSFLLATLWNDDDMIGCVLGSLDRWSAWCLDWIVCARPVSHFCSLAIYMFFLRIGQGHCKARSIDAISISRCYNQMISLVARQQICEIFESIGEAANGNLGPEGLMVVSRVLSCDYSRRRLSHKLIGTRRFARLNGDEHKKTTNKVLRSTLLMLNAPKR